MALSGGADEACDHLLRLARSSAFTSPLRRSAPTCATLSPCRLHRLHRLHLVPRPFACRCRAARRIRSSLHALPPPFRARICRSTTSPFYSLLSASFAGLPTLTAFNSFPRASCMRWSISFASASGQRVPGVVVARQRPASAPAPTAQPLPELCQ